ncbi:MAG TPA: short-chain dehydrogenase [Eubacterium sp.]|nr:short-chain dehydrogenase [Eubacterium sp.]HBZ53723.1 short-chain dehydrogenase [Eubacterium sp.]
MKIAIVTGASSGLGREFVKAIEFNYSKLDEIWIIARRKERLEALSSEIKIKTRIFDYDLTDDSVLMGLYDELELVNPDVKLLVNAAGYGAFGDFSESEYGTSVGMVDLNCKALTALCYMVIPHMSKRAKIVNMASAAAFCPQPKFAVYAATKSYVLSFSRALGFELKDRGITVMAVCPGPVKTEFFDFAYNKKIPFLKRMSMANPSKVVKVVMKDLGLGKDISVYGLKMKAFRVIAKILPTNTVIKMAEKANK